MIIHLIIELSYLSSYSFADILNTLDNKSKVFDSF